MAKTSKGKLAIPHCVELPGGLEPGSKLRIRGSVPKDSISFMVNFLCGKEENANNALLVLIKLEAPSVVVLNSFLDKTLGEKEKYSNVPFARGQDFELEFVIEEDVYKVLVNGEEFCQRKHRVSAKQVRFLQIEGNVELKAVDVELQAADVIADARDNKGDSKILHKMVASAPLGCMPCQPYYPPCQPCVSWYCSSCFRTPCCCRRCCRCCCSPCRCCC